MLGFRDADHQETSPDAEHPVIVELACSLAGTTGRVTLTPGSLAHSAYGRAAVEERYFCRFGPNPLVVDDLARAGLVASGVGEDGSPHILELRGHPFFVLTLSVPQVGSHEGAPHPLIAAFARTAARSL